MSISPDARISLLDSFGGASASENGIRGQVPTPLAGDEGKFLRGDGTWAAATATGGGTGTVTSVDVSGGSTGLSFSGGPVTASGVITASGTLAAGSGGTGKSTYSVGDILYATGATSLRALAVGASGQILTASAGVPVWADSGSVPTTRNVFASGALTGGGALSADITIALASIVAANTVGSTTRIPVVTFDAYGRITTATDAAITSTGGGGGSTVYNAQATVDFGFATGQEGDIATVTVSATWVLATSIITVAPYAYVTADHDPEDYAAESITAYAANFATGVGFDIIARAPNNSWGRYVINAMGV
jgi:hypothetical protein